MSWSLPVIGPIEQKPEPRRSDGQTASAIGAGTMTLLMGSAADVGPVALLDMVLD